MMGRISQWYGMMRSEAGGAQALGDLDRRKMGGKQRGNSSNQAELLQCCTAAVETMRREERDKGGQGDLMDYLPRT